MKFFIIFVTSIFGLCLCAAGFYYGRLIPFSQQWPLYEALRNTAAIIFAVVGAWLAIIYPDRLKISFGQNTSVKSGSVNMGVLLTPAVHSTIILVCLLLIGIIAPILKQVPGMLDNLIWWRGISFFVLTVLTLWQIAIVILAVVPAGIVKEFSDNEKAKNEIRVAKSSLVNHIKKSD